MTSSSLYTQLLSTNTLKIGWHLYRRDQKQNFIETFYPTAVASAELDTTIEEIRKRLINNDYKPRNLLRVEIPKKGLGVRPGATMWVEDAIVMNAIMYLLVFQLNSTLSPNVYSFRLREDVIKRKKYENGKDLFNSHTIAELPFLKKSTIYKKFLQYDEWYTTWVEFDQRAKDNITTKRYQYMATSDSSMLRRNARLVVWNIRRLIKRKEIKLCHTKQKRKLTAALTLVNKNYSNMIMPRAKWCLNLQQN